METKPITVYVNLEAAHLFETAPQEQRVYTDIIILIQQVNIYSLY